MSFRVLVAGVVVVVVIAGCGDGGSGADSAESAASTRSGNATDPSPVPTSPVSDSEASIPAPGPGPTAVVGTRKAAQDLLDGAEAAFLEAPSARVSASWTVPGEEPLTVARGAFDLLHPASRLVWTVEPGSSIEYRMTAGHAWFKVRGDGVAPDIAACWMHTATGEGEAGQAAALSPAGLMLLEPKAVGLLDGGREGQVVVDLLLDEAGPALMPKVVNKYVAAIDPKATVRGVVTVRSGRYVSLQYRAGDVLGALEAQGVPADLQGTIDQLQSMTATFSYSRLGEAVAVPRPPDREVIDLGDRTEVLLDPPARDAPVEPCAAAR